MALTVVLGLVTDGRPQASPAGSGATLQHS
jgi:hypothetical protein